jgi:hypothetical protein
MTTDDKVACAIQLAKELKSRWEEAKREESRRRNKPLKENDLQFPKNEWRRWANYFGQVRNLDRALRLAEYLSRSPTVRREPKEAARIIHQVIQQRSAELRRLSPDDLAEIFGYVSRELEWLNFTQGSSHEEGAPRHPRRESGRRHRSH